MAFTYTAGGSDRDNVRLIIGDTDSTYALFQDAEIDAFLTLEDGVVKLAAAQALDAIASNKALLLKKGKVGDVEVDGPALAKALRDHAQNLRDSLANEVAVDWAEQAPTTFAWREIIWNDAQRTSG